MNSNYTDFDIYSIFNYDDAKKYLENLTCQSDNDCPEDSYCIENKCIITFYCKKKDKSNCGLFETLCDGKTCYKKSYSCDRDEDCLSNNCSMDGLCEGRYSNDKYTIGHFTFENAKKYFEKLSLPCGVLNADTECPKYTLCHGNYDNLSCKGVFYCNEDNSTCSFGPSNKDGISKIDNYDELECIQNDDCISNFCVKNKCKKVFRTEMDKTETLYGLEEFETCYKDEECFSNFCYKSKIFYGYCMDKYKYPPSIASKLIVYGIVIFVICLFIYGCYKHYFKRFSHEKENRFENLEKPE